MITGYKLRINGGAYTDYEIDVGLVYEYLFEGLSPSTEYDVELAAYDEEGEMSFWSSVVSATTDAAPEMFSVVDASGNDVTNDDGATATVFV